MLNHLPYPAIIRPLTKDEGSGYLVEFPDIPGCYADGETPEEAIIAAEDALASWLKTAEDFGDSIPKPAKETFSGQWRLRIPKSLHAELVYRAKYEGVSLNTLVTTFLAKSMGETHSQKAEDPRIKN